MSRSKWKGFISDSRNTYIFPHDVSTFLNIHDGRNFIKVSIDTPKVGLKRGAIVRSKKSPVYKK